jgi:fructokinase
MADETGSSMRIGIDLGGTKTETIALDETGQVMLRRRVPTPADDYKATLSTIIELVAKVEREVGRQGTIGVASPGSISTSTGLIKNSNSTVLNGRPLDRDLSNELGRPIRLENDANCFALSEAVDGAGAKAGVVFGVILGTGVGGGLVVEKKLIAGQNRIAGEWGHNPLPWPRDDERPGPACYCGQHGCIETFLNGAALARDYRSRTGKNVTALEITRLADDGNGAAEECLRLYQDRLARGLATIVNVLDPDIIVLGGGLSNIAQLYAGLPKLVGSYAFSDGVDTAIKRAIHGDSSGVRGAARLWP